MLQLLNLLDVIIDNAGRISNPSIDPGASASEQPSDPQASTSVAVMNVAPVVASAEGSLPMKASSSDAEREKDAQSVLDNLPRKELQLLCSLLAHEGYAEIYGYFLMFDVVLNVLL